VDLKAVNEGTLISKGVYAARDDLKVLIIIIILCSIDSGNIDARPTPL